MPNATRPVKTLIVMDSFRRGGSERQAVELAKRLDRRRFAPMIACFQKTGPLLSEVGHIDVHDLPLAGFLSRAAWYAAKKFTSLVHRESVEIVQCFDFYSNIFAIPLARLVGVPMILAARRDEAAVRTKWQHRAELLMYRLASGVIANAGGIKEQLVVRDHVEADRVWVIHNGIDLDRFDQLMHQGRVTTSSDDGRRLAVIANLRPEKGHLVLLDAIARLINRFPLLQVFIAGNGPMKDAITTRIGKLNLSRNVMMTGEIDNVPAFLAGVDVVVLPSLKNEGFPNAVMEAMAAGKAVVATDTGGTGELVVDGLTGLIVRPNDVSGLADRLTTLCADPERVKKMGEAGRRRIEERFTVSQMTSRFESLYEELLTRG